MIQEEIYRLRAPYREDMSVRGYRFGKGEKAACIVGPVRGNEVQQLYICSQLVRVLKELENNGSLVQGKEILVIPIVNYYSMNLNKRFFGVGDTDLNRVFPGDADGDTPARIVAGIFEKVQDYSYGIQMASHYKSGAFVPHVRMLETGYQNPSLANLFGMPYVYIPKPKPFDTKTLNFNWQSEVTAAFSLYTNSTQEIDTDTAEQAVSAILRFLTRMGIVRYESHSGYISHVIGDEDLTDIHAACGGIFRGLATTGQDVRYGNPLGEIVDPYEGSVKKMVLAPTDGIVFFAHTENLITEGDVAYRLIHRLHQ